MRPIEKKCENPFCGQLFTITKAREKDKRFCSVDCVGEWRELAGTRHRNPDAEARINEKIRARLHELVPEIFLAKPLIGPTILIADCHCPAIHEQMFARLRYVQKRTGIKQLGIIGDLMDMRAFSGHAKLRKDDSDILDAQDFTRDFLTALSRSFERILLVPGNHDYWLIRYFEGDHSYVEWMSDTFRELVNKGKLQLSEFPFIFVHDAGQRFGAVHQRTFSGVNPAGVARDLEARWPEFRDHHVIVTHGHLEASMRSWPGHTGVYSLGCMTDRKRTYYPFNYPMRHGTWNAGFAVIAHGWFWPISEIMSDEVVDLTCRAISWKPRKGKK